MFNAAIYGCCGTDPQERQTRNGQPMATVSLAVNVAKYGGGEDTEWISLLAFGKQADVLLRHYKGDLVSAMGSVTRNRYTTHDGQERVNWQLTCKAMISGRTTRPGAGKRRTGQKQTDLLHKCDAAAQAPFSDDLPI